MFIHQIQSAAYGDSEPKIILTDNKAEACKIILTNEVKHEKHGYFMFDITGITLDLDDTTVTFRFDNDVEKKVIDAFRTYFEKQLTSSCCFGTHLNEGRGVGTLYMTYQEFADHITDLKEYLVYTKDLGDDPFVSYAWFLEHLPSKDDSYVHYIKHYDTYPGKYTTSNEPMSEDNDYYYVNNWTISKLTTHHADELPPAPSLATA